MIQHNTTQLTFHLEIGQNEKNFYINFYMLVLIFFSFIQSLNLNFLCAMLN